MYENYLKNKEKRHRKMEELRSQKDDKRLEFLDNETEIYLTQTQILVANQRQMLNLQKKILFKFFTAL